jgi:hypothetical protein
MSGLAGLGRPVGRTPGGQSRGRIQRGQRVANNGGVPDVPAPHRREPISRSATPRPSPVDCRFAPARYGCRMCRLVRHSLLVPVKNGPIVDPSPLSVMSS